MRACILLLMCVGHYQKSKSKAKGDASCPYCRGAIPNVAGKAAERAKLYSERAVASSKGSEDRKKYAKLAVAEFESLMEILNPDEDKVMSFKNVFMTKALMITMADQPNEAIAVTTEFLLLSEKYPGTLGSEELSQVKIWQAEAYLDCGKWKNAIKIYKSLIKEFKQHGYIPYALVFIGYSRALYELGKYDEAIEFGNMAFRDEMMRSRPGVHKYVALSQKAKGNIDEAKKTVSRAILYEKHWDKVNMQENKQLLRELNNL